MYGLLGYNRGRQRYKRGIEFIFKQMISKIFEHIGTYVHEQGIRMKTTIGLLIIVACMRMDDAAKYD